MSLLIPPLSPLPAQSQLMSLLIQKEIKVLVSKAKEVLSKEEIAMLSKEDAEQKGYATTTKFFIILGIIVLIAGFMGSGLLVKYIVMLVGLIIK